MPSGVEGSVGEVSGVVVFVGGSGVAVGGVVVFVVVSGGGVGSGGGVVLVTVELGGGSVVVLVLLFDEFSEEPLKSTTGVAGTGVCNGEAVCGHTPVGALPEVLAVLEDHEAFLSFGGVPL